MSRAVFACAKSKKQECAAAHACAHPHTHPQRPMRACQCQMLSMGAQKQRIRMLDRVMLYVCVAHCATKCMPARACMRVAGDPRAHSAGRAHCCGTVTLLLTKQANGGVVCVVCAHARVCVCMSVRACMVACMYACVWACTLDTTGRAPARSLCASAPAGLLQQEFCVLQHAPAGLLQQARKSCRCCPLRRRGRPQTLSPWNELHAEKERQCDAQGGRSSSCACLIDGAGLQSVSRVGMPQ